jgi:hypothetical protein
MSTSYQIAASRGAASISIYQNPVGFRIVCGDHCVATGHRNVAPRVYANVLEAFCIEGDARVKAALVLVDPACAKLNASAQHYIVPNQWKHSRGIAAKVALVESAV